MELNTGKERGGKKLAQNTFLAGGSFKKNEYYQGHVFCGLRFTLHLPSPKSIEINGYISIDLNGL